jgi:HAD superfamily hydrolase (TIGR01490 family)
MTRLALFDMDRTLLEKETASLYVKWQRKNGEATTLDLTRTLGWVLQYTLGVIDVDKVARKALEPLTGTPESEMWRKCAEWFPEYVAPTLSAGGLRTVRAHQATGDVVAIVTGASPYAATPLARLLGIDHVVSSVFEVDAAGNFTGRPEEPLCFREGKLARARQLAARLDADLAQAVFYTDSVTDLPLLEVVAEPVVVNPDRRLRTLAHKRGWRIERWY